MVQTVTRRFIMEARVEISKANFLHKQAIISKFRKIVIKTTFCFLMKVYTVTCYSMYLHDTKNFYIPGMSRGVAGVIIAPPPFLTMGTDYAHPITNAPPSAFGWSFSSSKTICKSLIIIWYPPKILHHYSLSNYWCFRITTIHKFTFC